MEIAVIHCWRFMGGWRPEALPLYAALYGWPADADVLIEGLIALRDAHGHAR